MSKDKSATPATDEAAEPRKGKGLIVKLLAGTILLGAGGGGTFAAMQAGLLGGQTDTKEDNTPKLVRKGETDPYAPPAKDGEALVIYGDGGSEYRTLYHVFEGGFTSNLKESDGLVQLSLAASTRRDGRVLMWLKKHELAIRSAILVELADTPESDVMSPDGKQRLERRLTKAINTVLTDKEGFGGVDAVHFQSFIVQ